MTEELANRLINESSPYLQQHAFNPVQWLPWGDEAFSLAARRNRPVFLSIGYSTCHWCHVMARESFEDPVIADYLNRHFIAVKVDREERPDLDRIYMAATQALTGGGGWPMSVFLRPDRTPFYAGTYFPPRSKFGRPGFLDLLTALITAWNDNPDGIADTATTLTDHIRALARPTPGACLSADLPAKTFAELADDYDRQYGGFGPAPKFPRPATLSFLLTWHERTGSEPALEMALTTLRKMAEGGMYDQLGGGFHRYAVDNRWRIPHFEKMLYDQAQLAALFFRAAAGSGDPFFRRIGDQTLDYVLRDLRDPAGAFYAAEDADSADPDDPSRHGEGAFYLWRHAAVQQLLGPAEAALFCFAYGIETAGNALEDPHGEFVGANILYRARSREETAAHFGLSPEEIDRRLAQSRASLLLARSRRPRPHRDDKILCSWNGLMLSALAAGFSATGTALYRDAGQKAADFLLQTFFDPAAATLRRRFRAGQTGITGQLDDYAFLVQGLLDLAEATGHVPYRQAALRLTEKQIALFADHEHGGFFETAATDPGLIARMKNDYDAAEPAANSVAALNLLRLAPHGRPSWRELAHRTIAAFAGRLTAAPHAMPLMVCAFYQDS
ncbi:MAG: thioredoxin domain-containing protein [Thermodesulfobacteriota bacterium]